MELRNVNVSYQKGKYQYKKVLSGIMDKKYKVYYSGPIESMSPVFVQILGIMRSFLSQGERLTNESRKALKNLEAKMKDPRKYFDSQGITHIIIYEHVQ